MKKTLFYFEKLKKLRIALYPRRDIIILAILIFTSSFIWSWNIGKESLWYDEGCTYLFSSRIGLLLYVMLHSEANAWLYYMIMNIWTLVGHSEVWMRLLSVVFACGALVFTYLLGKQLHSRLCGLSAALVLTLNTFFLYYAQEARAYVMFSCLFLVSSYYLFQLDFTKRSTIWRYSLVSIMLIYTHIFAIFILPIQFCYFILKKPNRPQIVASLKVFSLISLTSLPLILFSGNQATGWIQTPDFHTLYSFTLQLGSNNIVILFIYVTLATWAIKKGYRDPRIIYLVAATTIPAILIYCISLIYKPLFVDRYLIFSLNSFILLVGYGFEKLHNKLLRVILTGVFLLVSATLIFSYHQTFKKEPWREVVKTICSNYKPGDRIIILPMHQTIVFQYYQMRCQSISNATLITPFAWEYSRLKDQKAIEQRFLKTLGNTGTGTDWVVGLDNYPKINQKEQFNTVAKIMNRNKTQVYKFGKGYDFTTYNLNNGNIVIFRNIKGK